MRDGRDESFSICDHLQALLASEEFSRAGIQARALEVMVRARLEGTQPTGTELARAVYGRADDSYVKAVRQVVREIRLKLSRLYSSIPDSPIRFEIPDGHYVVDVVRTPLPPPACDPPALPAPSPPEARTAHHEPERWSIVHRLSAVAFLILAVTTVIAWRATATSGAASSRPAGARVDASSLVVFDTEQRPLTEWQTLILELARVPIDAPREGPLYQFLRVAVLGSPDQEQGTVATLACRGIDADPCRLLAIDAETKEILDSLELPIFDATSPRPLTLHAPTDGAFPANFDISSLEIAELDADASTYEVVASVQHNGLFPTEHVGLSLGPDRTWIVLFDYWTMGYASAVALPDSDGDGADEIVVFGARNADQVGFATVLPPIPSNLGFRGRTPEGRRPTILQEIAHYPVRGLTITLPSSPLASPFLPEFYALRAQAQRVSLTRQGRALEITYNDGVRDPFGSLQPQIIASLSIDGSRPALRFRTHDFYLRSLSEVIVSNRIRDLWKVRDTESLTMLAQDMASRIQAFDAESPRATWRLIDPEALTRRFTTGSVSLHPIPSPSSNTQVPDPPAL